MLSRDANRDTRSPHPNDSSLSSELAAAALTTAVEIADELVRAYLSEDLLSVKPDSQLGYSLAHGSAGFALFLHYCARGARNPDYEVASGTFLDHACASIASVVTSPGLFGGFAGVAWVVAHVSKRSSQTELIDLSEIDSAICKYVAVSRSVIEYDLISGLVGLGVYALERYPVPSARACLEAIVERLTRLAEFPDKEHATWAHPPSLIPVASRERYPEGWYNLGVAHGIPGLVSFLARVLTTEARAHSTVELLHRAVNWMLAQRLPESAESRFPTVVAPGHAPVSSRLAWCYGDPGVAATLVCAGQCIQNRGMFDQGIAVAHSAATRHPSSAGVVDASFCHGSAGLMHLFARMAQQEADSDLQRAADYWARRTLGFRRSERGFAKFQYFSLRPDGVPCWVDEPGLLEGAAGIGLSLLSASGAITPDWDAAFAVGIPQIGVPALGVERPYCRTDLRPSS